MYVSSPGLVAQGFAGVQHVLDTGLGERVFQQVDEQAPFDGQQPFFIDPAAAFDVAAAEGDGSLDVV